MINNKNILLFGDIFLDIYEFGECPQSPSKKSNKIDRAVIYCDASVSHNPGQGFGGIIIKKKVDGEIIGTYRVDLGDGITNNTAEYIVILKALEIAVRRDIKNVILFSDSRLAIMQLKNKWQVTKSHLLTIKKEIEGLASYFEKCVYEWIPRGKNKEADSIASGRNEKNNK